MSIVFFQIGTNDGNDNFLKLVKDNNADLIILVEPNTNLIDSILKNYKDIKNVYIYNKAIYYENNKQVELVIPSKNGKYGSKADNGLTYHHVHFSLFPMNDWGNKEDMVKINADTITFEEICKNHNLTHIDYLQIDTEGFDTEIIKMIDFSKIVIKIIRFEKWNFDKECFTKHCADLSDKLGKNGMNDALNKLIKNNYIIEQIKDKDGDDYIAILQN